MDRDAELRGWKANCVELQDKVERLEAEVARLKSTAEDAARAIDGEIKYCDMMRAKVDELQDRLDGEAAWLQLIIDDKNAQQSTAVAISKKENTITEQDAREIATQFFYWWHNQPGENTIQGFSEWIAVDGRAMLNKLNEAKNG